MKNVLEKLRKLLNVPEVGTGEFESWREQDNDAMKFLHQNAKDDWCVIYSGSDKAFIHGVLVPEQALESLDTDDLLKWQYNPYHSWRVTSCDSDIWIEAPLAYSGSKTLKKGKQLVFVRHYEDASDNQRYVEILQKFTHSMNLKYSRNQKAWCKKDESGDVKPLIKIEEILEEKKNGNVLVVLFDRNLLSAYATLTNSVLVRMFDFLAYYEAGRFPHMYHQVSKGWVGSFYRGVQLLKSTMSTKEAAETVGVRSDREEKYETFTVLDWPNKRIVEMSCSTDTYKLFPAFFRQEVLARYKSDPKKYSFDEYCVDGTPYGINDEGQVHVWLVDLGRMPYKEQQYWKLYNEEPRPTVTDLDQGPVQILKGVLNKGSFEAQMKGSWDYPKSSVARLKETLQGLHASNCLWWKTSSLDRINQVKQPIVKSPTDSADWEREILALRRLVIEGLQDDWLKTKLKELKTKANRAGSINHLEKYLEARGYKDVSEVLAPLRELNKLRNRVSPAHEQLKEKDRQEAQELKAEVLEKHGSYRDHYDCLVSSCNETFVKLKEILVEEKDSQK